METSKKEPGSISPSLLFIFILIGKDLVSSVILLDIESTSPSKTFFLNQNIEF